MELNPGYALITTDEYKDLIEISIYYEEIILENKELKKEISEIQKNMLEENIKSYYLRTGKMEEVTNPKNCYFPYDKEFIEKLKVPIKDVIEFIRLKKTDLLEKEEKSNE